MLKNSYKYAKLLTYPLWIFASFIIASTLTISIFKIIPYLGFSFSNVPYAVLETSLAAIVYVLMLVVTVGIPVFFKKIKYSKGVFGITGLPKWSDIAVAPAGFIVYMLISAALFIVVAYIFPSLDLNQVQQVGFEGINQKYQYYLAFITLVIIAPVAEELMFRGFLFTKLRQSFSFWPVAIVVSIAFGAIHGAWNVAIDTFALSMIMCILRERTGQIWSSILLHMLKNGLAFFILFINPLLSTTLGS